MNKDVFYGLEIENDVIKLSRTEYNGNVRAGTSIRVIVVSGDITDTLRSIVSSENISKKNFIVLFPRKDVLVKHIELPTIKDAEMQKMLDFQIIKENPFPPQDVYVCHNIVGKDVAKNRSKIVLAIVKKEVMNSCIAVLEKAGIQPRYVVLGSYALAKWHAASFPDNSESALILDLDESGIELVVTKGNKEIEFSRNITVDGLKAQIAEVKQTLRYYDLKKIGPLVKTIVVSGVPGKLEEWKHRIKEEFNVPVHVMEVDQSGIGIECPLQIMENNSLSEIIGLSLFRPCEIAFNFIPKEISDRHTASKIKRMYYVAALLLLSVITVASLRQAHRISVKQKYQNELEQKLKETIALASDISEKQIKTDIIESEIIKSRYALDTICEGYSIIPDNVYISFFQYSENAGVAIQGSAFAMPDVFNVVSCLEKARSLGKVKLKYANKRKLQDKEIIDFQIDCKSGLNL